MKKIKLPKVKIPKLNFNKIRFRKIHLKADKNKLVFKIPLRIISAVAVMMVALCVFLNIYLSASQEKTVVNNINNLAENNAYMASSYLNNMQTLSKALALEVYRYKELDSYTRDQFIKKDLSAYLDDSRIFSAYVAFEPNAMFEQTADGRSYYAYKFGTEKKLDTLSDYSTYKDGEYYAVSKQTKKPHISEPYSYQLSSGETVWLITISNPILDEDNNFLGVANTDILTDTINHLSYDLGGYSTSCNYILSAGSNYVSNTADQTKAGTKYDGKTGSQEFRVTQPLKIEGIDENWTSTFVVQKSEALREISVLIVLVGIVGLIGIAAIGSVVFYQIRRSLSPIDSIVALSTDMGNGKLHSDIEVHTRDELGELAAIFKDTSGKLSSYIEEISDVLVNMSNGNLRLKVEQDYVGDFAPIKKALLEIIDSLNKVFGEIEVAAQQVASGAGEIANGAQALSSGATEQAGSLEELSASINEVSRQVKQNAENAGNAKQLAQDAERQLDIGKQTIGEMTGAIDRIRVSSDEITKIIKTIDDIAFQTNILALNAAVEAARAGAAGRGFAVVADEVRNLASKSAEAAKHTTTLIEDSVRAVDNGTKIADRTADLLNQIVQKSTEVNHLVTQIAAASSEQANFIEQIDVGVSQISAVVQNNSATAEESAAAAEELSAQAGLLRDRVARFELKK
ncbi:methyl-accepting chemotaxis protein [Caproiciproducens sp. CPB-2]|uniref:methyl-accepting chemotaxis protein n=1 Tax=unclassified Caproiciproducens TaxID=2643836 RepID=UPI0023DA2D86|nr:methyl-accepting chemotaxis protein [Caproiciproducens sp. CPB-2]MDF1496188.1 methyl-accepting chemotaxis protein [Caproiciproducens sp. CPB-2]